VSKYTPGVWSVGADIGSGVAILTNAVAHNRLIGLSCYGAAESEDERQANALLMAAAPTLLAELTQLVKQVKETCRARKFTDGPLCVAFATANSLVKALKRKGVEA